MTLFSKCCQAPVEIREPKICPSCKCRVYETTTKPPPWYQGDHRRLADKQDIEGSVYERLSDPRWFPALHRQRFESRTTQQYNSPRRSRSSSGRHGDPNNNLIVVDHAWRPTSHYADHSEPHRQQRSRSRPRSPSASSGLPRRSVSPTSPNARYVDQVRHDIATSPRRRQMAAMRRRSRSQDVEFAQQQQQQQQQQTASSRNGSPSRGRQQKPREVYITLDSEKHKRAEAIFRSVGLPVREVLYYQDEVRHEVKCAYMKGDMDLASKIEDAFLVLQEMDFRREQQPPIPPPGVFTEPTPFRYPTTSSPSPPPPAQQQQQQLPMCPSCGSHLRVSDNFCSKCGEATRPTPPSPTHVFCVSCGAPTRPKARFCAECGVATVGSSYLSSTQRIQRNSFPTNNGGGGPSASYPSSHHSSNSYNHSNGYLEQEEYAAFV
eukprot:PhM_4_TR11046/c0_g1_i1/m.87624